MDTAASNAACEGKATLTAAGSSAQKNAMDDFASTYIAVCKDKGKTVNVAYNPSGSGAGARSSSRADRLRRLRLRPQGQSESRRGHRALRAATRRWNLPLVFGPVAIAYNLDGVDDLDAQRRRPSPRSSPARITKWNDPAIAALNSGATLPRPAIIP